MGLSWLATRIPDRREPGNVLGLPDSHMTVLPRLPFDRNVSFYRRTLSACAVCFAVSGLLSRDDARPRIFSSGDTPGSASGVMDGSLL